MGQEKVIGKVFTDEELTKKAKDELNEDPKRIEKDMKAIREWIKKQPHISKTSKQDDIFLLSMLRGCKFSLEKTKQKIEAWNTIRNMCPEIFDNWDVEDPINKELIPLGLCVTLPGYDKKGRKVMVQRLNIADPKKFTPDQLMRVNSMITDIWMKNADRQAEVTTIFEEIFPSRPKVMHFLNMPGFMEALYNICKGFMKKKMQERMVVHPKNDFSALVDDLGLEVLPEEYGGTNGTLDQHAATTAKEILANREWLLEQTRLKANEKKRQGMVKSYSDIFGMEGSFRQLDFD